MDTVELEEKALTWQKGEGRRIEKVRGMGDHIMSVKHEAGLKLEFALHSRARSVS